ncbi:MAG: hypothetical protein NUW01_19895 [Gemmatimonadaceae bacterium]|nr:hypothetical protein [Gemmatimonadaceae bacterium]
MTWWGSVWAQFLGELFAGAILVVIALYVENRLDEERTRRQDARERRRKHEHE